MSNISKYNLPWKVVYLTHWDTGELELEDGAKVVMSIEDCDDNTIVTTDCGYYGPKEELAEFIVNTINESITLHEVKVQCGKNAMSHMAEYHRAEEFKTILKDILNADERGQGLPFKEAMAKAYNCIKEN